MVLEDSGDSCSGDAHDTTLLWVELHSPGLLPCGKFVQVFFQKALIGFKCYLSIDYTIIGKSLVLELMLSGRSLIKIKNRTGPKTDPWGTPLTTGTFSDDCPSTKTCCVLEFRNDEIH